MTSFPAGPIGAQAELYLGAWTDISAYVLQRDGSSNIAISRGRPDESSQMNPSQAALQMKNPDGRFTIMNPTGPYYGLLTRNTPLRLSLPNSLLPAPYTTPYLRMEDDAVSYASCPAAAGIELSGSMDIRLDLDLSGYGFLPLAGMWSASSTVNQRCWMFGLNNDGSLFLSWTTDGTFATLQSGHSDTRVPLPLGRLCVRVTLDATTGNLAFYTAPAAAIATGPWTSLGTATVGGATTVFTSSSAPLTIGYSAGYTYDYAAQSINPDLRLIAPQGAVYDMQLLNASGALVADPAFDAQGAGATSWTDTAGNPWTLTGTAEISDRTYRFHGEMSEMPKATDPSATDVYVSAVASGVMRRLQQAQSPLNSPFYRACVRLASPYTPVAYWPCEDGAGSTQIASALSAGTPMHITGSPQLASSNAFVCSDALPVINGSTWTGSVTAPTADWSNGWITAMLVQLPAAGDTDNSLIARIATASTAVPRIDVLCGSANGGKIAVAAYDGSGALLGSVLATIEVGSGFTNQNLDGVSLYLAVVLAPDGTDLDLMCYAMEVGGPELAWEGIGLGAGTIGAVTSVTVNPLGAAASGGLASTVVGHIAVHATAFGWGGAWGWDVASPLDAWLGEVAAARYQRLCTEEGISCRIYGHTYPTAAMGYQSITTLPNLLQEVETLDRGMQYEPRTVLGLAYRPVSALYNQTPTVTADYSASDLDPTLAPTSDDHLSLNDVTASNVDGSSARQVLTSGPMSIQAPPNGISRIDTQVPVNAAGDGQLASIAGWILHTATDPRDRVPTIPFNMARTEVPAAVALLDVGDNLHITDPPEWIQYDTIEQLGAGYSETFGPAGVWTIDVNGIPAYPYTIAQAAGAGGYAVHVDTDETTLTGALSATDTQLSFTTAPGYPPWTTAPTDYPFDVNITGERVTVAAPGTALGIDPFLAAGAANYQAQHGTLAASGANGVPDAAVGYSTEALLVTPAGTSTSATAVGALTAPGTVSPATAYTLWGWVLATTSGRSFTLFVNWWDDSTYVSSTLADPVAVPAGLWTLITATGVTSPASGVNAGMVGVGDFGTPAVTDQFGVWGMNWTPAASIAAASPQSVTAIRSVNGVAKAQAAGAAVSLFYPPIVGL